MAVLGLGRGDLDALLVMTGHDAHRGALIQPSNRDKECIIAERPYFGKVGELLTMGLRDNYRDQILLILGCYQEGLLFTFAINAIEGAVCADKIIGTSLIQDVVSPLGAVVLPPILCEEYEALLRKSEA